MSTHTTTTAAEDLAIIDEQERVLRFPAFTAETAWQLGCLMRSKLAAKGAGATVEIEMAGQVLFTAATMGATPGQADWIRRKRNVVRRFARSTYGVGRMLERDGQTMLERHGLELKDYAAHGGGFPLWVTSVGFLGSIIVSGLPQRDDHGLVVESIGELLGVEVPRLP